MVLRSRVVFVAVVSAVVGLYALLSPRNLALRKPVRMSSVLIGAPTGAVNGAVEWGSYAVHSRRGPTWLEIDLNTVASVGIVRVVGRGDGFHTEIKPMIIEHSLDGHAFMKAARCGTVLTQVAPCVVDLQGAQARYVRIAHPTHLVLSEVEVFPAQ